MKERAAELKAPRSKKLSGEADLLEKFPPWTQPSKNCPQAPCPRDRACPAVSTEDLVRDACLGERRQSNLLFQAASKFKTRYSTLGFDESAALDDGNFWPTTYAITELTAEVEHKIVALIIKAAA